MNIVIVFPKKEISVKINSILKKSGFPVVAICQTGAQALQAMGRLEEGLLLSAARLVDMTYSDLKENLPPDFKMIVLATQGQQEQYGIEDVVVLSFPFKAYELIEIVEDYFWSLKRSKKNKKKGKVRNEKEMGIILRAKERMMQRNHWTEEEAHRFLQKTSMDTGRSLVETAACILEMF